jgi:hypothetical protein
VAVSNWSYRSTDDMADILRLMFPDDPVCKDMTLGKDKLSYVISHGLGPYFHDVLLSDIKNSNSFMTLALDETTTAQTKKQLDMHIRYWSESANQVVVRYLASEFMGHADAEKMHDAVKNAMEKDGLSLKNLIMLSSDGPNVYKSLFRRLDADCKTAGSGGLLDVGTCNLHKVHNAFGSALQSTSWETDAVIIDIYQWFKLSAARREDYKHVQKLLDVPEKTFLRFVECRWLSLLPALDRVLEQFHSLQEYFTNYLPAKQPQACKNERYMRIQNFLKQQTSEAKIAFLISISATFTGCLNLFQTEGPLIHMLYDQLEQLYKKVLSRYLKEESYRDKSGRSLVEENVLAEGNELDDDKLDIGHRTRDILKKDKVSVATKKLFMCDVRKFMRKISDKLRRTIPLDNSLLRDLAFLHPLARAHEKGADTVTRVARKVPHVISDANMDKVIAQYKCYQQDAAINDSWYIEDKGMDAGGNPFVKWRRLDVYWAKVFTMTDDLGQPKYHHLKR